MRDPFSWSLPLGRMFGVTVKVHILFIIFVLAMWLRAATGRDWPEGSANAVLILLALTFVSVLLHEFGHCFAARGVDGEADEILLWPLGGLARCDVPQTPRANFVTAAGGPFVNLLLCLITGAVLVALGFIPPFNPVPSQVWSTDMRNWTDGLLYGSRFSTEAREIITSWPVLLLAQFFWINWFLLLLNVLLPGFPLDGGQMLQAMLWRRMGYRSSMQTACYIGFVVMIVVGLVSLVWNEVMVLALALFIYATCRQQLILLETGMEDSVFGYDFSQGYTSLEETEEPKPKRKRLNFFQRWLQRRAQKKLQREMERAQEDERRMDELLEKIQRYGRSSLTDEENRFLKRVSDRFRNRP